jgi:uncharacterized delta-60 repeat protein
MRNDPASTSQPHFNQTQQKDGVMNLDRSSAVYGLMVLGAALVAAPAQGQGAGSLDGTFGTNGSTSTTLASNFNGVPLALFELSNDDILAVVSGGLTGSGESAIGLVRYKPNGKVDTTFGSSGVAIIPVANFSDPAVAATLDASGNIVLSGTAAQTVSGTAETGLGVIRITPSGQLDTTFGSGGTVTTFFGNLNETAGAVLVQPNGQIVVGGFEPSLSRKSPVQTVLIRYNANGALDTTFGSGGIVQAATAIEAPASLSLLSNGDYLAINGSTAVKFSSAGVLESSITASPSTANGSASTILLQSSGDFVAATGTSVFTPPAGVELPRNSQFINVARFVQTGTEDSTFTSTTFGYITLTSSNEGQVNRNTPGGIGQEPAGQIVVAGGVSGTGKSCTSSGCSGPPGFLGLARLDANGGLDSTFGSGGLVTSSITAFASALVVQSDGNIVVAGQAPGSSGGEDGPTIVLARFLAN